MRHASPAATAALIAAMIALAPARGAEIPEVFVQTGHTQGVNHLALSGNQRFLVTAEGSRLLKLWEVESGRELRTIKVEGGVNNVHFADDSTFIVVLNSFAANMQDYRAEVYNTQGEKTGSIDLPRVNDNAKRTITKNRKYFYTEPGLSISLKIFDIRDGSEIKLPENTDDLACSGICNLGFGYFGIFHGMSADAGLQNLRNTGYVIYDQDLKVRKRGMIKGQVSIGGNFKVDPGLKYVYKNRDFGDDPRLTKYDLDNGEAVASVKSKKSSNLVLLPDGRAVISVSRMVAATVITEPSNYIQDLSIVEFLDGGLCKERTMTLEGLSDLKSVLVGRDGLLVAGLSGGAVRKYDYSTGRETGGFGTVPVAYGFFSYSNGRLMNMQSDFSIDRKLARLTFNLWNLSNASLEKFNVSNTTHAVSQKQYKDPITITLWALSDPDALYSIVPREFFLKDYRKNMAGYERPMSTFNTFLKEGVSEKFLFQMAKTHIAVIDRAAKVEAARLYAFSDGEWIIITPEGSFNASPNGARNLNVRVGGRVYSIDNFYEKYYNPGLVAAVLQGGTVAASADMRKGVLPPPEVRIVAPADGKRCPADTVTVTVSARDMGGGIDEIRLYHNGKAVGEDARGIQLVPKGTAASKRFAVTLVDGQNTFRATGFSRDRTESNPSEVTVFLAAPQKDISLYLFAVGINAYQNPALNLNYAEPDARALVGFFRGRQPALFKHVYIMEYYNDQATKAGITGKLVQLQNTNPQDVVLIYLAGHGENAGDSWYFIPHELTYPEREADVVAGALSSDELAGLIKRIRAQKVLVLIDACKAGAALVAFRGFEDRKALSQLSRSTGVHVVAASTNSQFAAEVKELGHGVFTYTLLQGLGGKAAARGEAVTVRKLMGYVEEHLPEITKKYQQGAQYPVVNSQGMDFPLIAP